MPRRSATWRATVALEKKMALQFKQSAQRRRTQRLRSYDPTLTVTQHGLNCRALHSAGACNCA